MVAFVQRFLHSYPYVLVHKAQRFHWLTRKRVFNRSKSVSVCFAAHGRVRDIRGRGVERPLKVSIHGSATGDPRISAA